MSPDSPLTLALPPKDGDKHRGRSQAYDWRNIAHVVGNALLQTPVTSLDELARVASILDTANAVWDRSMNRLRVLNGKPDPGRKVHKAESAKSARRSKPEPRDVSCSPPSPSSPTS